VDLLCSDENNTRKRAIRCTHERPHPRCCSVCQHNCRSGR
jgi:hypothetical protein